MLQQMRSGAASWIAKGLMVLLVLSFGAWGVADYIRNFNTGGDVAKVGDQSITQAEFSESWRREVASMQRRFGPNFNRSEEHTSELQSLMRISYAVFCLKKKQKHN